MDKKFKSTIEIEVRGEPRFRYGQKIFVISPTGEKEFSEPCPICEGTGKVEIKGLKFDCPSCSRVSPYSSQAIKNRIFVFEYKVTEYIINEVHIKGPDYKSSFSAKEKDYSDLPFVTFSAFTRWGNGYDNVKMMNVPANDFSINPGIESIVKSRNLSDYIYTEKKLAAEAITALKKRDAALLEKFNEEHGTAHQYPYEL